MRMRMRMISSPPPPPPSTASVSRWSSSSCYSWEKGEKRSTLRKMGMMEITERLCMVLVIAAGTARLLVYPERHVFLPTDGPSSHLAASDCRWQWIMRQNQGKDIASADNYGVSGKGNLLLICRVHQKQQPELGSWVRSSRWYKLMPGEKPDWHNKKAYLHSGIVFRPIKRALDPSREEKSDSWQDYTRLVGCENMADIRETEWPAAALSRTSFHFMSAHHPH